MSESDVLILKPLDKKSTKVDVVSALELLGKSLKFATLDGFLVASKRFFLYLLMLLIIQI
jgi:hypothetical protein